MKELDIEELLLIISEKNENIKEAENAFILLHNEFSKFIYNYLLKYLPITDNKEEIASTIKNDVLLNIWEKPLKFNFDSNKFKTQKDAFNVWIAKIARNKMIDTIDEIYTRKNKVKLYLDDDEKYFEPICSDDEINMIEQVLSINRKHLDAALKTLSERDRSILLTFYEYFEEGRDSPTDVLDRLEVWHNTTRGNIRVVRMRALKKIVKYFSENTHLRPVK